MTTAVRRRGVTGNEAVALAWRQINPDVVAAYPITPSTQIVERFSQYVADGEVSTEFVPVESEHSALSACIGAAASGARVMTATSSQGLALMHEILYIASGLRLPIVMGVANRALSAPLNIHGDHSDAMGSRDAGWLQLYAGNVQEAYDLTILAVRVAERARLPVMVCLDGFTLSHSLEPLEIHADDLVRAYVGDAPAGGYALLNGEGPLTVGPLALPDAYMDFRYALAGAMGRAEEILEEEVVRFNGHFQTHLPGLFQATSLEQAGGAIVLLGSQAETVAEAVAGWRAAGQAVGLVRLVAFRPFPARRLADLLGETWQVVVMERADTLTVLGGPLGIEVRAALYETGPIPAVADVIYGLGGRELTQADLDRVGRMLERGAMGVRYLGVAEEER